MNCIFPPELNEAQILAYLNGATDKQVIHHLERCPYCREKMEALDTLGKQLAGRFYRVTCPAPLDLGEYLLGMMSDARAQEIAKHIVECPHCAVEFKELRDASRQEFPSREEKPIGDTLKGLWHNLADVLTGRLVTGPTLGMVGVRGSGRRPLIIEVEDFHIVLDVQMAAEGRVTIGGQIASQDLDMWTGAHVELWQAGDNRRATIDDLGTFQFEGALVPGPAELLIISPKGKAITVPNMELVV